MINTIELADCALDIANYYIVGADVREQLAYLAKSALQQAVAANPFGDYSSTEIRINELFDGLFESNAH